MFLQNHLIFNIISYIIVASYQKFKLLHFNEMGFMTSILFPSNTVYGTIINQGAKYALSIGIATISGLTQLKLRQFIDMHKDRIEEVTSLPPNRASDFRRMWRPAILILNTAFLFNEEKTSLSQFVGKHFFWVAIEITMLLQVMEPFNSSIKYFCSGVQVQSFFKNTSEKITDLTDPLFQIALTKNPWLNVLGTALFEEFVFRAILQEGFLRQLPKLVLRVTNLASPEFVDSPISKVIRIGISSLIFGLAHLHKSLYSTFDTTLAGVSFGYLHENIGFFPAILAHFDVNFYCKLK